MLSFLKIVILFEMKDTYYWIDAISTFCVVVLNYIKHWFLEVIYFLMNSCLANAVATEKHKRRLSSFLIKGSQP